MNQTVEALLKELQSIGTTDRRRLQIGKRLEEIGDPRQGVGVKEGLPDIDWLPVVPGGKVSISRHWLPNEPEEKEQSILAGTFCIEPFYIAKYLITFVQYQAFVDAEDGFDNLVWWDGMVSTYQRQELYQQRSRQLNNPRDSISWYQSVAFARWLTHRLHGLELPHPADKGTLRVGKNASIRLPTEWEWQFAAQNGIEVRKYPWGEAHIGYANTAEAGLEQAIAVGMYPQGTAVCGALDMAGNLMEWCANDKVNLDIVDVKSKATKVLRGGDWGYGLENAACTYCDDEKPHTIDPLNGFRLVLG